MFEPNPMSEWDDLDIYDREAADIRRSLDKINLAQWTKDLYTLDNELFEKLFKEMNDVDKSCKKYYLPKSNSIR